MFPALSLSDVVFIMLMHVKMSASIGILTFMSKKKFVFSWVKYEKFYFSTKTYIVGTQKKCLDELVLLASKICKNL